MNAGFFVDETYRSIYDNKEIGLGIGLQYTFSRGQSVGSRLVLNELSKTRMHLMESKW